MTICPKCKAENRPEAAFCARCGSILLAQPATKRAILESVPLKPEPPAPEPPKPEIPTTTPPAPPAEESIVAAPVVSEAELPAIQMPAREQVGLRVRPEGTIFGGHYSYKSLVYEDEHENLYTVTEINQPPAPCVRVCSNTDCRTIHIPTGMEQENYCTYCGKPLETQPPTLVLEETDRDQYSNQVQVIEQNLAHPNVHPPISTFSEDLEDGMRYYLVTPYSLEVPETTDVNQVLSWGLQLAQALDYLHAHGVSFGPEFDSSGFGLVDHKIVWRNFKSARVLPMLADREKINNVRLLALSLYSWITGKATYISDTSLHPNLNRMFSQALVGEGFTSGSEFAEQIQQAMKVSLSTFNLDYHVGRRTHPGQKRSTNEDSLLSMSRSSVQKGISEPMGIFAIADGMGGHATGDLASSLAIQSISQKASTDLWSLQNREPEEHVAWLKSVVLAANQAVYEARLMANNDMGSTLACALLLGDQAFITHQGDSRIYLLRDGAIQLLTTDHSVVQQLVSIGKISPEQAREHPQRNVIYRSLGEKPQIDVDVSTQALQPEDMLLICSDGLNGMLDDQKIQIIVHESSSPQVACDYLIDAANLAGGEDNISIILIKVISA